MLEPGSDTDRLAIKPAVLPNALRVVALGRLHDRPRDGRCPRRAGLYTDRLRRGGGPAPRGRRFLGHSDDSASSGPCRRAQRVHCAKAGGRLHPLGRNRLSRADPVGPGLQPDLDAVPRRRRLARADVAAASSARLRSCQSDPAAGRIGQSRSFAGADDRALQGTRPGRARAGGRSTDPRPGASRGGPSPRRPGRSSPTA